jgi:hypothetical protein
VHEQELRHQHPGLGGVALGIGGEVERGADVGAVVAWLGGRLDVHLKVMILSSTND